MTPRQARILRTIAALATAGAAYLPAQQSRYAYAAPIIALLAIGAWTTAGRHRNAAAIRFATLLAAVVLLLVTFGWRQRDPWGIVAFTVGTALIYAVFTLGLSVQYAFGGLIQFGHVASMALGAYTVGLLTTAGWTSPGATVAAVVVGIGASIAWAFTLGLPTLRLREDYLAITTIAAGEVLRLVINNEDALTNGPRGVHEIPLPWPALRDALATIGPGVGTNLSVAVVALLVLILVAWTLRRIVHSPWGRLVRAVRDDEHAAGGLGVPVFRIRMQVLILGSSVAALSGALLAWQRLHLVPHLFVPLPTFFAWAILILGGLGSLRGVVAGSFLFALLVDAPQWIQFGGITSQQLEAIKLGTVGLLLAGIVLLRPEGLFGSRDELEVMR